MFRLLLEFVLLPVRVVQAIFWVCFLPARALFWVLGMGGRGKGSGSAAGYSGKGSGIGRSLGERD